MGEGFDRRARGSCTREVQLSGAALIMTEWLGWTLDPQDRVRLLERFAPAYADIVADHVTLGPAGKVRAAPAVHFASVVGHIDDGAGLEALVVNVDGRTRRPDGGVFHITWSLDPARGRKPAQSNEVLARFGWAPVSAPVAIDLTPATWTG